MTSDEALQVFIDGKIPKALQENYANIIGAYRSAWAAALRFANSK